MAVAFGSSASATKSYSAPDPDELVITKPTGLAEGDFMVAVVGIAGTNLGTWTISGWTTLFTVTSSGNYEVRGFWKVATAGDAAASDFTFSMSTADTGGGMAGFIIRCTSSGDGFTGAGNITSATDGDNAAGTSQTFTPGVTALSSDNLYILGSFVYATVVTQSAYAITNNNPTWTEREDTSINTTVDASIAVATAIASASGSTGDYSLTLSTSAAPVGFLIAVEESTDVTPTISVINMTMAVQAPTVTGGAVVSPAVVDLTMAVQDPALTQLATEWENEDTVAAANVTNEAKNA